MMKNVFLVGLTLFSAMSAHATCYRATATDGFRTIMSFRSGTVEGAKQAGKMVLRNTCQQAASSLDVSTFEVEDSWCQQSGGVTSITTVCSAQVYGCCH